MTEMTLSAPEKTYLVGFGTFEELHSPIRALLFGKLADKAFDTVQQFRSDLYHDVHWIDEHVNGPMSFYFGVRAHGGTSIGTDVKLVGQFNERYWRVELTCEPHRDERRPGYGSWHVTLTELPPVTG